MYKYTITLKVIVSTISGDITIFPVFERTTNTPDIRIVKEATVHRYIRDNWGSLKSVEVARISGRKAVA